MQAVQFGSLTEKEFVTLVSERFASLGIMEEDACALFPTQDQPTEEMMFALGMATESEDPDLIEDMPSPGTIRHLQSQSRGVELGANVEGQQVLPSVTPLATVSPSGNAPSGSQPVVRDSAAGAVGGRVTPVEDSDAISNYLRSVPKDKASLFDGLHVGQDSVQSKWKDVMMAINAHCTLSRRDSNEARVRFLQSFLAGRPMQRYLEEISMYANHRRLALAKDPADPAFQDPLPHFDQVVAALEGQFLVGQRKSRLSLTDFILKVKLVVLAEKYTGPLLPTLAQVWQDFKALLREREDLCPGEPSFDRTTLVWLYLNVLPTSMYELLRHVKDGNGNIKDPDDPVMLETSILNLGDHFLENLKMRRDVRAGKQPASGPRPSQPAAPVTPAGDNPKKRGYAVTFGAKKGGQVKGPKAYHNVTMLPEYKDPSTQSFWIRDLTRAQIEHLAGKCLLCHSTKHLLVNVCGCS